MWPLPQYFWRLKVLYIGYYALYSLSKQAAGVRWPQQSLAEKCSSLAELASLTWERQEHRKLWAYANTFVALQMLELSLVILGGGRAMEDEEV